MWYNGRRNMNILKESKIARCVFLSVRGIISVQTKRGLCL